MPAEQDILTINCPAKLNLTLAVGPAQADGMHPIASVMVALDFGDDLTLRTLDDGPSRFARRFADDAPKAQPIDWPIESDLAFRAHALMERAAGRALPVDCTIAKRIPAGAGLGGGSSNAAGVLVGLRQLFELPVSDDALMRIAQDLGADVIFLTRALLGQPAAMVTGIGDIIEPMTTLPSFHAVLVFPDGACPTAGIYQRFDQLHTDAQHASASVPLDAWRTPGQLPDARNDLTQAAIHQCPPIQAAMDALGSLGVEARLTGSGSCVFAIVESQAKAATITQAVEDKGLPACLASHQSIL